MYIRHLLPPPLGKICRICAYYLFRTRIIRKEYTAGPKTKTQKGRPTYSQGMFVYANRFVRVNIIVYSSISLSKLLYRKEYTVLLGFCFLLLLICLNFIVCCLCFRILRRRGGYWKVLLLVQILLQDRGVLLVVLSCLLLRRI